MDLPGQALQMRKGNGADFAVFEGNGIAAVHFTADSVKTQQLAGHLETSHLIAAILDQHVGLEETAAHRVDRLETLPGAIQIVATLEASSRRDQFVQLLQLVCLEADRQA